MQTSLGVHLETSWKKTKRALLRAPVLQAWRQMEGRRQLRHYHDLLQEAGGDASYSTALTKKRLAERMSSRQSFLHTDGAPRVAALGFNVWEQHGLWQSFAALGPFDFIDLGALHRAHPEPRRPSARRAISAAALAALDALPGAAAITLLFVYADSDGFDPAVLAHGLRQRGIWLVILGLDDKHRHFRRYEGGSIVGQDTLIPHADLLWSSWPSYAQVVQQRGGISWFAPQGAHPDFFVKQTSERDIDVLFLGQKYGRRGLLVQALRNAGISVSCAGRGWPQGFVTFRETVSLYNRAKVVLGAGATGCMPQVCCLKGRDFEAPMSGAAYVTSYNAELTDCYHLGEEIACYSSFTECTEMIGRLLKDQQALAKIRHCGQARAQLQHTWTQRLQNLYALFP